jgi:DNA-binding phage protein
MNVIVAAAKKYQIEPLASLEVPRLEQFDLKIHRQFQSDLDHYMTQVLLDNSSRAKRDSVFVSPELKSSLRTYVHHLRDVIERSDDLSEAKRTALLRKLQEFESELEKKRLSLVAVTVLAITLLGAPGAIWASADLASKLLASMFREVGEAKRVDEATRRLPSSEAPMAITGPRPQDPKLIGQPNQTDIEGDIPF